MEDVKLQLQRVKRNNNELEGELRGAWLLRASRCSFVNYCGQQTPQRSRKRTFSKSRLQKTLRRSNS